MQPKFPIYVISKGRWGRRSTSKTLENMGVDYKIVVEPAEAEEYKKVIDNKKIIVLPSNFSEMNSGSIPVRNWVWEDSIEKGHQWHWILDDNIEHIKRFNKNMKINCFTPAPFVSIEDFVLRYENIGQAGMNYSIFCPSYESRPAIRFNTRVYSCILQKNSIVHRWRGRYNEDTDLSLRILKDGMCTTLFNSFLIDKRATMTQGGGNTDTIYNTGDERLAFAQSLEEQHPDVVRVGKRFNRWHHFVDYKPFENNLLVRREGYNFSKVNNEYGMTLKDLR